MFAIVAALVIAARASPRRSSSRAACSRTCSSSSPCWCWRRTGTCSPAMPGWSRSASRPSSASAPMRCSRCVILAGLDPLLAILLAGDRRAAARRPDRLLRCFACKAPISPSAPGSSPKWCGWLLAQWKALGGGTGTSLPREATRDMLGAEARSAAVRRQIRRRRRHPDLLAGAALGRRHDRLHLPAAALASRGWRWPPCATTRRRRARSASTRGA